MSVRALAVTLALLLVCQLSVASDSWGSSVSAHSVRALRVQCTRRVGIPRRECPIDRTPPHFYSYVQGTPLVPVLVGNSYAVNFGEWAAVRRAHLHVEWLDRHGHAFSRASAVKLTAAQAGQQLTARVCATVSVAASCVVLKLSSHIQTVAQYLQAACGSRRPAPPAYDPNFSLLSAPQVAYGWNPCQLITWAIDSYGEPVLTTPQASWQVLAAQAIAQVAAATGIEFVQTPIFSAAPEGPESKISQPAGVDLVIGFAPQPADIAGAGGPAAYSGQFTIRGEAELDSQTSWEARTAMVVLLHEIGHAMGLNHPVPEPPFPDPENEIMDPGNYLFTAYQPGDLCGLFELTWQQPCAGASGVTLGQGTIPD